MAECNEEIKAIGKFGTECSNYFGNGAYNCSDCILHDYCYQPITDECGNIFDEYRCKGCSDYDDCFYNECAAEAEWEMQQQFIKDGNKQTDTDATYYEEIISDDDIPF